MSFTVDHAIKPDDIPELARLHKVAFPDFFLSTLGDRFLREFYRAFAGEPTAIVVLARNLEGKPVGVVVGTTNPPGFFQRLLLRRFPHFLYASLTAAVRRPSSVPRLLAAVHYPGNTPTPTEGALLSSICVHPTEEGSGIGRRILNEWRELALQKGVPRAFLTTDANGNERVNAFYARDGWVLESTIVTRERRKLNLYRHDLEGPGA